MNIRSSIAQGAAWMVGFKLLERSLGVLSTMILARVLLPEDFGTVAMAMSFVALLELLTAFNFDIALIQKQTTDRTAYDTAWTFNCLFGIAVAFAMLAAAWPAAAFYGHPELVAVVCVLAIGSAVQGFENVGVVAFRKDLRFDREFRFLLGKKLAMFCTTVPLAFILRNYWALILGIVAGRIAGVALSYYVHPFRPRFSLRAREELMHFSKWLMGLNLLAFLKERSADLVIGRTLGAHSLGLFSVSYEISNMPATELVAPINRAVFPVYARIGNDRPQLAREYLSVMGMIVLVAVPAVAGIAATATLLVPLLLGPNWIAAAPVLSLLAFFGITQVMQSNAYAVYLAIGRPDLQAKLTIAHVLILIASLLVLVPWQGLLGAASAFLLTALLILPVSFGLILNKLDLRIRDLMDHLWRPILSATVMFFAVRTFVLRNPADSVTAGAIVHLATAVVMGVVIYVAMVATLWILQRRPEGAEAVVSRRVVKMLAQKKKENPLMNLDTRKRLFILLGVALLARILWWVFNISVIENEGAEYARLAENLRHGVGYVGMFGAPHVVFPPLFPALIALFSYVMPSVEIAGRLVSLLSGLGLIVALFGVTRQVFGERAAWVAAILATFHPTLLALSVSVYSETLAMCLVTTGGYLAIRALQNTSPWFATGAGALFGIAYLGRPEAIAFAGAAAGVLFVAAFAQRRGWQVAFRNAALTSVATLLIAAPYIAFLSSEAGGFRWESKSSLNAPVNARMAQNMTYPEAARGLNPDLTPAGPHLYADQYIVFRQPSAGLKVLLETGLSDPIGRAVSIARDLISAAFLGSPWIFLAAFAGVVATRWWRTATWEGLLWLSFCGLQFLFLFLLQYTFTRYFFPLLAVLIPLAAGGIALLWSVPALARRPAAAATACGGVACLIALASYSDTRQVGELLQSGDVVASEAGEWMKAEYAKGDKARTRPVVMGYGLVTTYYAAGDFGYMPYADESLALQYIHKQAPDFLVVRSSELRQAPYFGSWLERGIADECASPGFEATSPSGEVVKVWRWRCPS